MSAARETVAVPAKAAPAKATTTLRVGPADDAYEREADRAADAVMRGGLAPWIHALPGAEGVRRKCDACVKDDEGTLRRDAASGDGGGWSAPPIVGEVLRSPGQPLEPGLRAEMERGFGHDFSRVRVHDDAMAAESARVVSAHAYTVGSDVVFGAGRYAPESAEGRRLVAHELAHTVQQGSPAVVRRVPDPAMTRAISDVAAQNNSPPGAPGAATCPVPSYCPPAFCRPYASAAYARYHRSVNGPLILLGIRAAVNSRVAPLWVDHMNGGSAPRDLTGTFAADFTNSPTTAATTTYLVGELRRALTATPPAVPLGATVTVDIPTVIPSAVAQLGNPASANQMNFNIPSDVPGNLAGGIGTNQTAHPVGARPSPFNDERLARGTALVSRAAAGLTVVPQIQFIVRDTIDLCPGDCGSPLEQVATVPLSQWEATGISGDVPFWVNFPAPRTPSFSITVPAPPAAAPPPSSTPPALAPSSGSKKP